MRLIGVWVVLIALGGPAGAAWENDVRRGYVDTPQGQMHYRIVAPPGREEPADGAGVPLVALHLVPNSSQVFARFLEVVGQTRPALAFDLPGYGMSDPTPDPQRIDDYAEALAAAIRALGHDRVDLLGYHTGAAVAGEIALAQPDLVRHLVLVAIPVLNEDERAAGAALPPIPFDIEGEFLQREWQLTEQWRGPGQSIESALRGYAEKLRPGVRAERRAAAILAHDMADTLRRLAETDFRITLVRPKDDLWDASARARPLLPDAPFIELPDHGHGLFEVAPDRMAEIVEEATGPAR